MARIAFTPMIAELVGKLAGSVFQYSYGGWQVHTRASPANPQTERRQLRRGWFGWFAASWRNLTPTEQGTFITEAGTVPGGFRLFISSNINAFLIDEPTITTYVPDTLPGSMNVDINDYTAGLLEIVVNSGTSVVPAGQKLLTFATFEKPLQKRFTNPSMYSPIIYFDEGEDLSSPIDITSAWENLYGVLTGDKRVCIKSVLIDKANGNRGAEYLVCMPPITTETFRVIDGNGDSIIDADGTFIVYQ